MFFLCGVARFCCSRDRANVARAGHEATRMRTREAHCASSSSTWEIWEGKEHYCPHFHRHYHHLCCPTISENYVPAPGLLTSLPLWNLLSSTENKHFVWCNIITRNVSYHLSIEDFVNHYFLFFRVIVILNNINWQHGLFLKVMSTVMYFIHKVASNERRLSILR